MIEALISIPITLVLLVVFGYMIRGMMGHYEQREMDKVLDLRIKHSELYDNLRTVVGDEMQLHIRAMRTSMLKSKKKS